MKFNKYSQIENSYNEKFIQMIRELEDDKSPMTWIVMEKAHGVNFSGHYFKETDEVRFARRNGFLKEKENFYNYKTIAEEFEKNIRKLAKYYGGCEYETLSVFGELIGGGYDNLEGSLKRVQRSIDYCDKIKFMAFDLRIDDVFTDVEKAVGILCLDSEFFVAPVLGKYNSLDDALSHSPVFKSVISAVLGLPEHSGANEAEGIVIKPMREICTSYGDRIILKKKNPKFEEISRGKCEKTPKLNEEDLHVKEFVNENRYNSVRSKLKDDATEREIAGEFGKDVLEDYKKEYPYDDYDNNKKNKVRRMIGKEVWCFLRAL